MNLLEGFPVIIKLPVVWGDMDANRHVNHLSYLRYMESCRVEYFHRTRWYEIKSQTGVGPILASIEVRFRKPLVYPDEVSVGTRLFAIEEHRIVLESRVVSHRLEAVAAEGTATMVSFDYNAGKKAPTPEELKRRLRELEGK